MERLSNGHVGVALGEVGARRMLEADGIFRISGEASTAADPIISRLAVLQQNPGAVHRTTYTPSHLVSGRMQVFRPKFPSPPVRWPQVEGFQPVVGLSFRI